MPGFAHPPCKVGKASAQFISPTRAQPPMYENCEKRLDVYFVSTDANTLGLCLLPFALWESVARAAGTEILSQVDAVRVFVAPVCVCNVSFPRY